MTDIAFLTDAESVEHALPALELLPHHVTVLPLGATIADIDAAAPTIIVLDATVNLVAARNTAQLLKNTGVQTPLLLVLTEGGMATVSAGWLMDDVVLNTAAPVEIDARIRLAAVPTVQEAETVIRSGAVTVDEASYTARLDGSPLNLTYKEFELLKFLAQHPGRVFTRAQLLSEVWGYDYYGGTQTVDVHVRRLRAKLGNEHENLISTVRNVGYSFNAAKGER